MGAGDLNPGLYVVEQVSLPTESPPKTSRVIRGDRWLHHDYLLLFAAERERGWGELVELQCQYEK